MTTNLVWREFKLVRNCHACFVEINGVEVSIYIEKEGGEYTATLYVGFRTPTRTLGKRKTLEDAQKMVEATINELSTRMGSRE